MSAAIATLVASLLVVGAPSSVRVDNDLSQLPDDEVTENLETWLLKDEGKVLGDGGLAIADDATQTIRVVVRQYGENGIHYEATITLSEEGAAKPRAERVVKCEACSDTQLVEKVVGEVARVSGLILFEEETPPPSQVDPPANGGAQDHGNGETEPLPKAIGPVGYAGIGIGAVGLAAAIAGGVYLARGDRTLTEGDAGFDVREENAKLGGPLLGAGIGVLVVGAIMVGVDVGRRAKKRKSKKRASVGLDGRPGYVGMSLGARF